MPERDTERCQHAGLHDNYNAVDNIKLNMKLRGIKNDKLIEQTIANVGLQGVGKKKFRELFNGNETEAGDWLCHAVRSGSPAIG